MVNQLFKSEMNFLCIFLDYLKGWEEKEDEEKEEGKNIGYVVCRNNMELEKYPI